MTAKGVEVPVISGKIKLLDFMGSDNDIVDAARVSYTNGVTKRRSNGTLLSYLIKHRHTSPFEHCYLKFFVECDLATRNQWVRHRTLSYNEESRRYSDVAEGDYYVPPVKRLNRQDKVNRQASTAEEVDQADEVQEDMFFALHKATQTYLDLLKRGLAREVARGVLPQNTKTRFYVSGNLHNWLHFCNLRSKQDAQVEIREFSIEIERFIEELFPETYALWKDHIKDAVTYSKSEHDKLFSATDTFTRDYCEKLAKIAEEEIETERSKPKSFIANLLSGI
jgi:thymidylate synthase (FAD)